ncbi:pentapeptide repeat-containing protein [Nostoc parmelioides]|uniref:Pentapeptide repeat-containing protein n=1 Tax=Nostoc parmelioides FACHB-3921 TaxID=2692909 RepID=A0ABR8BDX5_9NOSO|nr:pentapeptide repeat-containing protein [Nostoc parmelioides]MBD2252063.1 pentapeptide repeat-containing protein [Nostoc parmelioides FACHB-3921]
MNKIKDSNKSIFFPKPELILALFAIICILIAIFVPRWIVGDAKLTRTKRFEIENAYRVTIIQGFGGLFFLSTAYFTWRNLKVAEGNLTTAQNKQIADAKVAELNLKAIQDKQIADAKVAELNLKATQDKQLTERFAKAVEMLGHQDIHVRLGAIYLLERISKDSAQDYWQIMEILTAYVREKSPYQYPYNTVNNLEDEPYVPLPTDIQAVLTVIGRREDPETKETISLDLSGSNLRGAKLGSANLKKVDFRRANLSYAYLVEAELENSIFYKAVIKKANLGKAKLSNAELGESNLFHSILTGANLTGANLGNADLSYTSLNEVNFNDTDLVAANLLEAHLYKAENLFPTQIINKAINWEKAYYDPEFCKQIGLTDTTVISTNNL